MSSALELRDVAAFKARTRGDPEGWLGEVIGEVATTSEVEMFNTLFKQIAQRRRPVLGTAEQ
jgi:hypothetical protein